MLDPDAVDALAREADVLVHLAFIILGGREETRTVNLTGSRNVFAAAARHVARLVYTSSVAAYGFHADNPQPLTEDVRAARQRALLLLGAEGRARGGAATRRPRARARDLRAAPVHRRRPGRADAAAPAPAASRCLLPDPGTPFQLVHHDDVADALVAATLGAGPPGAYNLAGDGTITLGDLARALGRLRVPGPALLLGPAALGAEPAARARRSRSGSTPAACRS